MRRRGGADGTRAGEERARSLIRHGYVIAGGTIAALSAAHIVGVRLLDNAITNLNADEEGNVLAWAGSASIFAAAFAALVLALTAASVDGRLLAVAGIAAALSLDDAIVLHERLAKRVVDALGMSEGAQRLAWPPIYLPLLAVMLFLLLDAARRIPPTAGRSLRVGLGLLGLAVATELVSAYPMIVLDVELGSWPDALEVAVEESAEIGGWLLIAFALAAAAAARLARGEPR